MMQQAQGAIGLSVRLYRLLLGCYPAAFRRQYGPEMVQLFKDGSLDACGRRGLPGLLSWWSLVAGDYIITLSREYGAVIFKKRSLLMATQPASSSRRFIENLTDVLDREPAYYQLLISVEPTYRMNELVESLALEGDPDYPETTLHLFGELGQVSPHTNADHWLDQLRHAARQIYRSRPLDAMATVTGKLLQLIYAEPRLYELVASVEPGYGLIEILESLALEVDAEEVESMLGLMRQLTEGTEV